MILNFISAPSGIGAGVNGTEEGPGAFLRNQISTALCDLGHDTYREIDPHIQKYVPRQDSKSWGHTVAYNRAIDYECSLSFQRGEFPILLGGDHSLSIGSILAARRNAHRMGKKFLCLYIDAHADINVPQTSPTGNTHGMTVAAAMGRVDWYHVTAEDRLQLDEIVYWGARDIDAGEQTLIDNIRVIRAGEAPIDHLWHLLDDSTHVHVSFDVDSLDPMSFHSTGLNVDAGIWPREVASLFNRLRESNAVKSLDIMEYAPHLDVDDTDCRTVIAIVQHLFRSDTTLDHLID